MDKVQEYLKEWAVQYIKNKDIIRKNILNLKENISNIDIFIEFKEKKQVIIVKPIITDIKTLLLRLNKAKTSLDAKQAVLVVLNNKKNLKSIKDDWDNLIKDPGLSIYFVNPLSMIQRIWIVYPYTHAKISTKNTLNTLFEAVQEIGFEEIEKRL